METVVVKAGDTLYGIAHAMTGDGNRWGELWLHNTVTLRSHNPHLIYPGEIIRIPIGWRKDCPQQPLISGQADAMLKAAFRSELN